MATANRPDESDDAIVPLSRDLKRAAATMTAKQARFMVDAYYQMQDDRLRAAGRIRAMSEEPHDVVTWLLSQSEDLERHVRGALDVYSASKPLGQWARSITGIGPVLSAGLLAHIDPTRHDTCGYIWRFAGLDPTVVWEKGEKRPWNAQLKTLCWKISESFVKFQNNPNDNYGKYYVAYKRRITDINDRCGFAEAAERSLQKKKFDKDTEAYKHYTEGKLPPAHIHARAERYAVKLFLSHYHWVGYEMATGKPPRLPYAVEYLGHETVIPPPNWP